MPVYGRARIKRHPKQVISKPLGRVIAYEPIPGTNRGITRMKREHQKWPEFHSPIARVEEFLDFPLRSWITRRAEQQGEPTRVLEWGCGAGRSIGEIARETKGKVKLYGYDYRSFRTWAHNRYVAFIHQDAERLPRYFKVRTLDCIYSHYGLMHHLGNMSMLAAAEYVSSLCARLRSGGILVTHLPTWPPAVRKAFKQALRELMPTATILTSAPVEPSTQTILQVQVSSH